MRIESRLKRIEKQLGIGCNIQRTFMVLCHPEKKSRSEAEKAEKQARIDRAIEEAIQRNPKCLFFLMQEGKDF
jgi:hypothetical protein